MKDKTISLNSNELFNYLKVIEKFSPSLKEPTMLYDYNKLLQILRQKELSKLIDDNEKIIIAQNLSQKFGDLTKDILKKSISNRQILRKYNRIMDKIDNELKDSLCIYAKQWGLSVLALFYYKNGNYQKAINKSIECIVLNEYLIREGFSSLLFRAAEQNKNILRVLFKSSDLNEATSFTRDFLLYLFNGRCKYQKGEIFYEKRFWNQIPYAREGYSYECLRAVVSLVIHHELHNNVSSLKLFNDIFSDFDFTVDNIDREIIANWILLKKLCFAEDYEQFFQLFTEFMTTPISKIYDILKVDAILDFQKYIVKNSNELGSKEVNERLTKFMYDELNAKYYLDMDLSARNLVDN